MMEAHLHALDMPTQNTSESDIPRIRDDDFDTATKSGSENHEGASGDDQNPRPKKKRYHRHTQHQIQEMEAYVLLKQNIQLLYTFIFYFL